MATQETIEFDVYDISDERRLMGDVAYVAPGLVFATDADRGPLSKNAVQQREIHDYIEGVRPVDRVERTVYRSGWNQTYYVESSATYVRMGRPYLCGETILIPQNIAQPVDSFDGIDAPPTPSDCTRLLLDVIGSDGKTVYSVARDQFKSALETGDVTALSPIA